MEAKGYRTKLKIGEVSPQREVDGRNGKVKVLDFLATNPEGNAFKYGIFAKTELFPYIKTSDTIDCDVKETPRTDGQGVNRNVVQIYVDGKPVVAPQEKKSWGQSQDSPEKRRSIERQASLERAIEFLSYKAKPYPVGDLVHWEQFTAVDVLKDAELFYQWIANSTIPQIEAPQTEKAGKATARTEQAPRIETPKGETSGKIDSLPKDVLMGIQKLSIDNPAYDRDNLIAYMDNLSGKPKSQSVTEAYSKLKKADKDKFAQQVEGALKKVTTPE